MKKYLMLVISFVFLLYSGVVYAAEEGEPYQKEDGYWYKMIDGKEYQVVNGNEGGSLTDAIKSAKDSSILDEEDSKTVGRLGGNISSAAGNVTSFLLYVMFAFCFVTSATDLLYISAPPLRPVLWSKSAGVAQQQNNYRGMGGPVGVSVQQSGNQQSHQDEQLKKRCFVSDELKYVMNYQNNMSQKALIMTYFKKRAYAIIVIVVVVFLLIGSSVFTDFGLNIGEMLLSFVK